MMLIWFVARDGSGIVIYIKCSTFYIFGSCLFSVFWNIYLMNMD